MNGWWTFGCFHLLAILNNTAVNISVQGSLLVPALSSFGLYLWAELLDYNVILCITFWETTKVFSTVTEQVCTSPTGEFQFLYVSTFLNILIAMFDECEVVSGGFDLHFLDNWSCWTSFHKLIDRLSSVEKCLLGSFAHFELGYLFFCCCCCGFVGVLYILEILTLFQMYHLQIFSPIGCLFIFFNSVLWRTRVGKFCWSSAYVWRFSSVVCAFGIVSQKSLPNPVSWIFLPVFIKKIISFSS